ncbi:MAG: Putative 3-methyladenine DNA glycosylase [Mycoplasmataceae bacterium]|nr:MAG: Putative 3-methyladenine DNA glycosylase [Mycoplasmataceae bacterium]
MNNKRIIDSSFFSVDALLLSKKLLGKIIARKINDKIFRFRIVEVEAYLGLDDEACHSHKKNRQRGKATPMYRQGGFTYIYLIYGMYYCFNIVSAPDNDPQSVLIRALEPIEYKNFNFKLEKKEIHTNGPGKLCRFLQLSTKLNDINLITSDEIWLEDDLDIDYSQIVESKRVNIGNVGEYIDKPWRFYIKNNQFVSKIDK